MIWNDSEMKLMEFVNYINSELPSISFSVEKSPEAIHFLDVLVTK
uniref:Uncharacterized protein n=1 Tax=Anguilla anguilla TaxID=7936 RepID=A0A0E9U245_ANGAN